MPLTRVSIALSQGQFALPDGTTVLNAPGDLDLGVPVRAVQSFYPDFARIKARGINVTPKPEGEYPAALVQCHRARAMTFHLLWHAVERTKPGGLIAVNGDKTDGIEAVLKEVKKQFDVEEVFSKAHGKLAWFRRPDPKDWITENYGHWEAKPFGIDDGLSSFPGIFSSDRVDQGSRLLAENLPAPHGKIADIGAGWGYLSRHLLGSEKVDSLDLIEADFYAIEAAKLNVRDLRATCHWGDALDFAGSGYDAVVMNPPFHTTRKPDPELGRAFIRKAAAMLGPKGHLWMVANRNLPYEAELDQCFQVIKPIAQNGGFKVIHASRPKTSRAAR